MLQNNKCKSIKGTFVARLQIIKKRIKKISEILYSLSYFIIFFITQLALQYLNLQSTITLPNYDSLFQPFLIAVQIAIGLTGLITMFYLGKIHDNNKDFFKKEVEFVFRRSEFEKILQSILKTKEVDPVFSKLFHKLESDFEFRRKIFSKMPSKMILPMVLDVMLFYGYSMFMMIYFHEEKLLYGFIASMISLAIGIYFFLQLWNLFERLMTSFDLGDRSISTYLMFFQVVREHKENPEYVSDLIKQWHEFLDKQLEKEKSSPDT